MVAARTNSHSTLASLRIIGDRAHFMLMKGKFITAMTQMAMLPLRPQVAQYINKCGMSPIFISLEHGLHNQLSVVMKINPVFSKNGVSKILK
jgi:hypothetical protein